MGVTNQLKSDGTLTTWRWPDNNPKKAKMEVTRVQLTAEKRLQLIALEERRAEVDDRIRRGKG